MKLCQRKIMTVVAGASLLLAACAKDPQVYKNAPASALAVTAEQKARALSQERLKDQPLDQLGGWLDAANDARLKLAADPANAGALSDYNFAVARVMDLIAGQKLAPWDRAVVAPSQTKGSWRLRLTSPRSHLDPARLVLAPADRYDFRRFLRGERVTKPGLGAPLVVAAEDPDFVQTDPRVRRQSVYSGLTAVIRFNGRNCEVVLLDPLENETVALGGSTYPLAGDHQGPLALALADLDLGKRKGCGLFEPREPEPVVRLAKLEQFNPNKIPVLFIHGLGGSTADWEPLLGLLRADPRIRRNYQFWFFNYSSLQPYATSAALLRTQLAAIRKKYPRAREIVVVGHSMGGMIGRLLLTDSGRTLWDTYFGQPPGEIPFSEVTGKVMTESLIFKPVAGISRVVFMSASHRGSEMATTFYGRLLATLLGNRISSQGVYREALAWARPEARSRGRNLLPGSSIELLAPDNLFIATVESLPLKRGVPFHSIVGDRGKGGFLDHRKPASSDGVVPYWSSHLPGARSEKVIPSGHWSLLHPLGMTEIKRILLEHLSR
jgi:pimeloyl-ACP methyl ester carboxylesterase